MQQRLIALLDASCRARPTPAAKPLVLMLNGYGAFRLTNQGTDVQELQSFRGVRTELGSYSRELIQFTRLLASVYRRSSRFDLLVCNTAMCNFGAEILAGRGRLRLPIGQFTIRSVSAKLTFVRRPPFRSKPAAGVVRRVRETFLHELSVSESFRANARSLGKKDHRRGDEELPRAETHLGAAIEFLE
jgi:hypothetical protein